MKKDTSPYAHMKGVKKTTKKVHIMRFNKDLEIDSVIKSGKKSFKILQKLGGNSYQFERIN